MDTYGLKLSFAPSTPAATLDAHSPISLIPTCPNEVCCKISHWITNVLSSQANINVSQQRPSVVKHSRCYVEGVEPEVVFLNIEILDRLVN